MVVAVDVADDVHGTRTQLEENRLLRHDTVHRLKEQPDGVHWRHRVILPPAENKRERATGTRRGENGRQQQTGVWVP